MTKLRRQVTWQGDVASDREQLNFLPDIMFFMNLVLVLVVLGLAHGQTVTSPTDTATTTTTETTTTSNTDTTSATEPATTTTTSFPSLESYSPCVVQCLALSIGLSGCSSVVDLDCFCPSLRFREEYPNCIAAQCPTELSTAQDLAQRFCAVASTSTSISFPLGVSSSTSGSISTTTATATATTTATPENSAITHSVYYLFLLILPAAGAIMII